MRASCVSQPHPSSARTRRGTGLQMELGAYGIAHAWKGERASARLRDRLRRGQAEAVADVLLQGGGGHQMTAEEEVEGLPDDRDLSADRVEADVGRHPRQRPRMRLDPDSLHDQPAARHQAIEAAGYRNEGQQAV